MHKIIILILSLFLFISCKKSTPCSPFDTSCNPLGYFLPDLIKPKPSKISFNGLSNLKILSATSVELIWTAATSTAAGSIEYNIYVASSSGAQVFATPLQTVSNVTTATITGITASTNNYYIVRAKDSTGNMDTNTNERVALFNGLIRYFPLDATPLATGERIGNVAVTAFASPTLTATDRLGKLNNVYLLNGTSQYFEFNQNLPTPLPTGANPKTFCAWVKTSFNNITQTILGYGDQANQLSNFLIFTNNGFPMLAYDQNNSLLSLSTANAALTSGKWNFVCSTAKVVGTANIMGFQINSTFQGEWALGPANPLNSSNGATGKIGVYPPTAVLAYFNGSISDIYIWNRVLTPDELQAMFKN